MSLTFSLWGKELLKDNKIGSWNLQINFNFNIILNHKYPSHCYVMTVLATDIQISTSFKFQLHQKRQVLIYNYRYKIKFLITSRSSSKKQAYNGVVKRIKITYCTILSAQRSGNYTLSNVYKHISEHQQ